jgi:uncharacterized protein (DUF433 family)
MVCYPYQRICLITLNNECNVGASMENLLNRIIVNPQVMVGKPIIKGTRITVQHILGLLAQGTTYSTILKEYPHITQDDIYACLLFAQQAIDSSTFAPIAASTHS